MAALTLPDSEASRTLMEKRKIAECVAPLGLGLAVVIAPPMYELSRVTHVNGGGATYQDAAFPEAKHTDTDVPQRPLNEPATADVTTA